MFSQLIDHTVRIASRSAIAAGVMVVLAATPIQAMAQGNYYCTGHTNTNNGEENGLHDGAITLMPLACAAFTNDTAA
ncbi:hypothetical protein ACVBEF_16035, partial [Glaciimonas sp. GG7]